MAVVCIGVRTMSRPSRQPFVAVIDTKNLRRASITSLLEPWAKLEDVELKSFTPKQADEALHADTSFRMLVFSVGGASIAEGGNLEQLRILRRLAPKVPLVLISDSEDPHDIVAAFNTEAQGFINSGISSALAFQALSFILNGGSYFPPSAMYQLQMRQEHVDKSRGGPCSDGEYGANGNGPTGALNDMGCKAVNLTTRERHVLKHLRMGESNKLIARRLGMTEGTVKVHIRQMMQKCQVANRTQLALGGPLTSEGDFHTDNEHSSATKDVAERQPRTSNGGHSV
jgi:DNA-binding NarL/FixJ family response regulator